MLSSVASASTAIDSFSHSINPDVISNSEAKNKKRKNRSRDDQQVQMEETEQSGKRIKRKHNKQTSGEPSQPVLVDETSKTNVESVHDPASLRKKKKDKGKKKEKEKPYLTQETDAEIEADSQASAAALLSAIIATMSSSQASLLQTQPPMPYGSHLPPPPPGHFFPFPPMPFGFPIDGTANPNVFPSLAINPASNGAPLSELASGSNEDILRALQEIDIGKLTAALKNIGDSGGNNGPASPLPQLPFMPSGTAPPTEITPISVMPVNRPPSKKAFSKNGHKRTIDMSLPGGEQHINPTHASMLSTKWLNASKLAELVREEGMISIVY